MICMVMVILPCFLFMLPPLNELMKGKALKHRGIDHINFKRSHYQNVVRHLKHNEHNEEAIGTCMETYTMRRATPDDKLEVLALNDNVYGGRDYLPVFYDSFMSTSNISPFVLLLHGKIVAFGAVILVDGGQTGIGRGARIHTAFAGRALGRRLQNYCVDWAVSKGISTQCFTEIHLGEIRRISDNYRMILVKHILPYMVNPKLLHSDPILDRNSPCLSKVTDTMLSTYFKTHHLIQYLFPEDRILVNSIPYRLMQSNIPIIFSNNKIIDMCMYTDVSYCTDRYKGLLSVGTSYPVPRPSFAYNIELYGEDNDSLEKHIVCHLKKMADIKAEKISVYVCFGEKLSQQRIEGIFSKYNIPRQTLGNPKDTERSPMKRVLLEASGIYKNKVTGMETYTMRRATPDDKLEVLALNDNVYGGRDYLPVLYDSFVSSSNMDPFVLLINGKIMAFGAALYVDGGETGIGRGGRIHSKIAGRHLFVLLQNYMAEQTKIVSMRGYTEVQLTEKRRIPEDYRIILVKNILPYMVNVNQLCSSPLPDMNIVDLSEVTENLLLTYFTKQHLHQYLFPKDRILVNSVPYRLMESNIPLIFSNKKFMNMCIRTDVGTRGDNYKGLLSIGTGYPVPRPSFAYNIELYGKDNDSLEKHILYHLKSMSSLKVETISLYVCFDEKLSQQRISEIFSKYNIPRQILGKTKETGLDITFAKRALLEAPGIYRKNSKL